VISCDIYPEVREHLKKVMQGVIESPSDISEIIEAVFDLASTLNNSDTSDSKYIQKKVTQYVLVSQARTDAMLVKKSEILSDLTDFKKKKDYVTRDPEMYDYLTVFMNVVTSSYRTSEAISKEIFQLAESDSPAIIESGKACLDLVPLIGGFLRQVADKVHEKIDEMLHEHMMEKAGNTVNSFYHKEMEEVAEYVGVSFLYKYRDYFRQIVINEKKKMEDESYKTYAQVVSGIVSKIVHNKAKEFAGVTDPEEEYETPAQILGYRDGNELISNLIAEGKIIADDNGVKFTRDQKIQACILYVKSISEINRDVSKDSLLAAPPNCCSLSKDGFCSICAACKNKYSCCTII
jgi:hypothetical protein